jgi:cystathionine beta-lyase
METFALPADALRRRRGVKWHRYPDDVLPAWVADMDFTVPEPVQRAIRNVVEQVDYGYPQRTGAESLEEAFAERMRTGFGWSLDPALVVPVADLIQAVVAGLVSFSQPGDGVVVQTPIYPPFLNSITSMGRRRVLNPLIDDGARLLFDPDGLDHAVDATTRVLLLCNPHNPSGRVLERAELEAIGRVAIERDLVIISDEIHCDLVYPGRTHIPVGALSPEVGARTVTINSATKGYNIAGLRCGVMHFGSEGLLARFREAIPERLLGGVGILGVDATVAAWREGQPWLERVMTRLQANRDRVADWVATEAPAIRHHPPEATYLAWLDCTDLDLPATNPHQFFLEEARVGLSAGADFGPGGEGCVRLNFATSAEILEAVLDRMGAAIKAAAGRGQVP